MEIHILKGAEVTQESALAISTTELRKAFEALIAYIEERSGGSVTLHDDYFWWIQQPAVYDVTVPPEPDALAVGQLTEAWQFLLDGVEEDRVVSRSAVWLSQVLRAVGEGVLG